MRKQAAHNRICKQCGSGFHARPSKIAEGVALFCSKACYSLRTRENMMVWGREAIAMYVDRGMGVKAICRVVARAKTAVIAVLKGEGVYSGSDGGKERHRRDCERRQRLALERKINDVPALQEEAWRREWRSQRRYDESRHWENHSEVMNWRSLRWYYGHKEAARAKWRRQYQKLKGNPMFRENKRKIRRAWTANAGDGYCRALLSQGSGLTPQEFPQEVVALKREELKLRRLIRSKTK